MRNEIRTVGIKGAGDRTDFHFDDGGCQTDSLHFDDKEGEQLALIVGYTSIEGWPLSMETIAEIVMKASSQSI